MKLLENVVYGLKTQTIFKNQLFGEPIVTEKGIRDLTLNEQVDYLYDLCCQPDSRVGDLFELDDFCGGGILQLVAITREKEKYQETLRFRIRLALPHKGVQP